MHEDLTFPNVFSIHPIPSISLHTSPSRLIMRAFSSIVTLIVISLTFNGCSDSEEKKTAAKKNVQLVANHLANQGAGAPDDATKKAMEAVKKMEEKEASEALAELLKDEKFFKAQVTDQSANHDQFMKDENIRKAIVKQVYDKIKGKLDKVAPTGGQNADADEGQ